jgi:hypothetical protein
MEACGSLKVAQNQEKTKTAGMDISGVCAVQCDHILVHSMVDLHKGEQ